MQVRKRRGSEAGRRMVHSFKPKMNHNTEIRGWLGWRLLVGGLGQASGWWRRGFIDRGDTASCPQAAGKASEPPATPPPKLSGLSLLSGKRCLLAMCGRMEWHASSLMHGTAMHPGQGWPACLLPRSCCRTLEVARVNLETTEDGTNTHNRQSRRLRLHAGWPCRWPRGDTCSRACLIGRGMSQIAAVQNNPARFDSRRRCLAHRP